VVAYAYKPLLERLRQENFDFEVRLGYTESSRTALATQ
jgi:hypothetical protein